MSARQKQAAAAIALAAVLGCAGASPAVTYQPLDVGSVWQYSNDLGETQTGTMVGHRVVLGVETAVRHEVFVGDGRSSQVFENFWTAGADGDLYLHGAVNYTDTFEIAYNPPVLMVDGPLELGEAWVTSGIQAYDLEGNPLGMGPFDYGLMVYSVGDVTVPAGTFHAYGIGAYFGRPLMQGRAGRVYDVLGRRLRVSVDAGSREASDWYAEDVGLVQHSSQASPEKTMKLTAWQPSPVRDVGWGRIKALFK
jgi:hypothetical protein